MDGRVYMNNGRWIVDCPADGCGWAYSAMSDDHRLTRILVPGRGHDAPRPLTALRCKGDRTGKGCGHRFDLAWPPAEEALAIERALFARPAMHRNWSYPETIDALLNENDAFLVGWTVKDLADNGIGVI